MEPFNIIFLDIDGVVNTEHHLRWQKRQTGTMKNRNWSPVACRHIMLLCEQFDARIVISSTWRIDHEMHVLRSILDRNDINPELLIGATPILVHEAKAGSFCRGDEIKRWLEENAYRNYVIIDDLLPSEFLEEQHSNLVTVKPDKGFAVKQAAIKAGEILNGSESRGPSSCEESI